MRENKQNKGFTLIEVLIGISLFAIITFGIFFTFGNMVEIIGRTRNKTLATAVLDKEIEILRNLTYDDVGITDGYPVGVLEASKSILFDGVNFDVEAFVRNIDDPTDGVFLGNPNDTAPADYKLVELKVSCSNCRDISPQVFTTWVAPENLESSTNNGSLFINVFDADGIAVSGADVRVVNTDLSPDITIIDAVDNDGVLKLIDIPPSDNSYEIYITKDGYSSAQTYTAGDVANPNPIQPHSTVSTQDITEISFAIDKLSSLTVKTQDYLCQGVGSIDFNQIGERLIGSDPDVPSYSESLTTDSNGSKTISSLPWDEYSFTNTDTSYETSGFLSLVPYVVDPDTTNELVFTVEPKASSSLLITVVDDSPQVIEKATVRLEKFGFDETQVAGQKEFIGTDWSASNYTSQDGNIDVDSVVGSMSLAGGAGSYPTSTNSWLISNTVDFSTTSTVFYYLDWIPTPQPPQTTLRFQMASNNDQGTWNFVGPDGTGSTYYTAPGNVGNMHDGNRYLRYKVYMNTTDANQTPTLDDVKIKFTSDCISQSNVFWLNITTGNYTLTVSKSGYVTATSTVSVGSGWQEEVITLFEDE